MASDVVQLAVGGILLGGIYGLSALGLSITFGVMRVLNLAHGEFLMLGALGAYAGFEFLGLNPFLAALLMIPVSFFCGIVFYHFLLRPISKKPPHQMLAASVLVTLGAALAIEDLTGFWWDRPVTGIAYSLPPLQVAGAVVSSMRLLVLLFICTIAVSFQIYLRRSLSGKAIRAVTQCREGAKLLGVRFSRISAVTFGLGSAFAAVAGVFYVLLFTATPVMGIPLTVKYMCIVVLGGMGSLVGSVLGGLLLGLVETITACLVGAEWSPCAAFLLLIATLIVKPEGLFGTQ